ncbi:MAG: TetR/AcrR family transcriptional regulator [Acidobacteriota bacterium]
MRLQEILSTSAVVFAKKGFHNASVRDISRQTGVSLSGLYYYFQTKEELLFLIIQNAFDTALQACRASIDTHTGPEKLRFFVRNHLKTFIENWAVAKVVVYEPEFLTGAYRETIHQKQRDYYELLVDILDELKPAARQGSGPDPKLGALALFGMMNWIFTWYHPEKERSVEEVADTMSDIFLHGYLGSVL